MTDSNKSDEVKVTFICPKCARVLTVSKGRYDFMLITGSNMMHCDVPMVVSSIK